MGVPAVTNAHAINGTRGQVELITPDNGGWAWRCHTCRRTAGIPGGTAHLNPDQPATPFTNGRINGLWGTAEGHCRRSALAHANHRCAGENSTRWQPTPHHTRRTS
jgi:hypothetical protein